MSQPDNEHPSTKETTIILNGKEKTVTSKELSFEALVELAFPGVPANEATIYTITYTRGEGHKPEGTLVAGESVKVKKGMIFNVFSTTRS